jgi:hypothetical protein
MLTTLWIWGYGGFFFSKILPPFNNIISLCFLLDSLVLVRMSATFIV